MMRRLTSAPKPGARASRAYSVDRASRGARARAGRSARRRSARGSTRPRRWRSGSRSASAVLGVRQRHLLDASRPSCSSAAMAGAHRRARPRGRALGEVLVGHADRAARRRRASAARGTSGTGAVDARSSRAGRGRRSPRAASAASATLRANGPTWSSERGERDQPVARHAAVGRLEPDDAAEARRAGGPSRRCRCRARAAPGRAATAAAEPPRRAARHALEVPGVAGRAGTPSSRWTSPSRTRPCWSCRAARRRPPQPRDHGRVVGRHVALEDPRAAGGGEAARCRWMSLTATGTPASGPRGRARGGARPRAACRGPAARVTVEVRADARVDLADALEVRRRPPGRRGLAPASAARARGWRARRGHARREVTARSPRSRGTRKHRRSGPAPASMASRGSEGRGLVVAHRRAAAPRAEVGLTSGVSSAAELGDVVEQPTSSRPHPLDLARRRSRAAPGARRARPRARDRWSRSR